jgi:hypothetical protein
MNHVVGHFVALFFVLEAGLACQSIAGIEQRRLGPCGEYCDTVMKACTGTNTAYANNDACMGVCRLLPEGNPLEPETSNSVACRLDEARSAAIGEADVHCLRAGPTGSANCSQLGATTSIGCESYCMLYQNACGAAWYRYGTLAQCVATCSALRDRGAFDAIEDYDGDTLQCRLVHVSAASVDPATHCEHAELAPPVAPCIEPADGAPDCEHYCKVIGIACQGEVVQYEDAPGSTAQCMAVCKALVPGTNADTSTNTAGCRMYHAYNALLDPKAHCGHAGPTGDGHCGTVSSTENALCDSYCNIVERACADSFVATFQSVTCLDTCRGLPDTVRDSQYSVTKGLVAAGTLSCRMLHAVRALSGNPLECPAALGSAICL